MSLKLECRSNWNVTQLVMSLKLECHSNLHVTQIGRLNRLQRSNFDLVNFRFLPRFPPFVSVHYHLLNMHTASYRISEQINTTAIWALQMCTKTL